MINTNYFSKRAETLVWTEIYFSELKFNFIPLKIAAVAFAHVDPQAIDQ